MFHDAYRSYGISIFALSVLSGILSIYFLYQFRSYCGYRFIKLRRPSLIFFYSIFSIVTLIILYPMNFHFATCIFGEDEPNFFAVWLMYLIQEFLIASMLILIVARCWLLYFDHSYNVSLVDNNWRGVISNEKNFWLKYRKTWGDVTFIMCAAVTMAVIVLIALCSVSIHILHSQDAEVFHVVNLCLIAFPCTAFLFFIIYSNRFKKLFLYDELMIIQEIQYLACCILLLIIVYVLDLCKIPKLAMVHQTGHILFCFLSSFVQTKWVVNQLIAQNTRLMDKKRVLKAPNNAPNLTMSQVLKNKDGFTMFMRHCQNELNVEGLLFIVEVAQYKAKLHDLIGKMHKREETCPTIQNLASLTEEQSVSDLNPSRRLTEVKVLPPLNALFPRETASKHVLDVDVFVEHDWMPIAKQLFRPNSNGHEIKIDLDENRDILQCGREDAMFHECAQYLFLKYIDVESDFTINVSYAVRKEMLLFFSKDCEKGFEWILKSKLKDNDETDPIVRSLMIKQHLYRVFDEALTEIWQLLSSDTYFRFLNTKQYQYLIKKINKNQK